MPKLAHTEFVSDELFVAARLAGLVEDECVGRWRLQHFKVTEMAYRDKLRHIYLASDHPERELERAVPSGEWVTLQRRMTPKERLDIFREHIGFSPETFGRQLGCTAEEALDRVLPDESQWVPVMSDTPAEIMEHAHALNRARGRVLISGLGLGCLPHALLSLDDVTRIDIIEIDPEVIALTGKYLDDERVFIWRGSAADLDTIPEDVRRQGWDYAWQDIWSHISNKNLADETAEHRISYGQLFDLWAPYVKEQSAWAYDQALWMEEEYDREIARELEFRAKLKASDLDEQVRLVVESTLRGRVRVGKNTDPFPDDEPIPQEIIDVLDRGGKLAAHVRKVLSKPDFWEEFERHTAATAGELNTLDTPNAHLEAEE